MWVFSFSFLVCLTTVGVRGSPISADTRTAQCRATCLDKFMWKGWKPSDFVCHEKADCNMCWESCELLNQNFVVWGSMCTQNDICFPGCQQACRFLDPSAKPPSTIAEYSLKFESPLKIVPKDEGRALGISWDEPTPSSKHDSNVVYVVYRRARSNSVSATQWEHVAQTSELELSIISTQALQGANDFKVVAVTEDGVAGSTITSYQAEGLLLASETQNNKDNNSDKLFWKLHLVTLKHNVQLGSVDAVVTWAAPGVTGNYLVTWEVKEGTFAITGHLYTDSTTVNLNLWPDTVYSVQVELVSSVLGKALRSESLTVDTHSIHPSHKQTHSTSLADAWSEDCMKVLFLVTVAGLILLSGCAFLFLFLCRQRCLASKSDALYPHRKCVALQRSGALRKKPVNLPPLKLNALPGERVPTVSCPQNQFPICAPALVPAVVVAASTSNSPIAIVHPPPNSASTNTEECMSHFRIFMENASPKPSPLSREPPAAPAVTVCLDDADENRPSSSRLSASLEYLLNDATEEKQQLVQAAQSRLSLKDRILPTSVMSNLYPSHLQRKVRRAFSVNV